MAKFCGGCGGTVSENAKFCPQCGTSLAQGQPPTMSFEGVASRSVIQQIGAINVQGMNEEQLTAFTKQLSQLLEGLRIPTQVSATVPAGPVPPEAREVADAVERKLEEAKQRFGTAAGDSDVYLRLGHSARLSGNYAEALRYYDQGLALDTNITDLWLWRAQALGLLGRDKEALASFDKALALEPGDADIWCERAISLFSLGRNQEALASVDQALALQPDDFHFWWERGVFLQAMGHAQNADESFKKANELAEKGP